MQRGIVCDLAEVERRRLYLPKAYGSLFEFCTDYLGYSRSSAGRRISAARCIARFPRMAELFRNGEIELTVLSAIAGIVTKENCAEIAGWLRGRSLREVETFIARRQPAAAVKDRVREIFVLSVKPDTGSHADRALSDGSPAPAGSPRKDIPGWETNKNYSNSTPSAGSKMAQLIDNKIDENRDVRSAGEGDSGGGASGSVCASPAEQVVSERKFKVQFAVDPEFMEQLARVRSLLSTKYPGNSGFEKIFNILMSEYLERNDPERRHQRRETRKARKYQKSRAGYGTATEHTVSKQDTKSTQEPGELGGETIAPGGDRRSTERDSGKRTRHIPRAVRDEVFVRDGGRCTFSGTNGRRCEETKHLQMDHIVPFAKGGANSPDNLRLLCARHNRLAAEVEFGKAHMEKYTSRE